MQTHLNSGSKLFDLGIDEIIQHEPTIPKGYRLDHVLYKGLQLVSTDIDTSVTTDHFPIVTKFEL